MTDGPFIALAAFFGPMIGAGLVVDAVRKEAKATRQLLQRALFDTDNFDPKGHLSAASDALSRIAFKTDDL